MGPAGIVQGAVHDVAAGVDRLTGSVVAHRRTVRELPSCRVIADENVDVDLLEPGSHPFERRRAPPVTAAPRNANQTLRNAIGSTRG